jgi:lipoprotein-releasing system ATP-binding protein
MTTPVLRAHKIRKSFFAPTPLLILKEISIEIQAGESVAITGKSGEGKSTLLHILASLEKPCSGEIELCGYKISNKTAAALRNTHVGFVFQAFHLLEESTVLENVLMPARIARKNTTPGTPAHQRALELLHLVGLSERAHFLTKLLSGGEKQRAAIARALCNDPDLIIADEPSGNLDQTNSNEIHELLLRLVKEKGKSLIVATHDLELAKLCDRTFSLKDGFLCTY